MRKSSPNPNPGSNHNFDEIKFCVSCYAQLLENQVHMLNLRKSSSVFPVLLNSYFKALLPRSPVFCMVLRCSDDTFRAVAHPFYLQQNSYRYWYWYWYCERKRREEEWDGRNRRPRGEEGSGRHLDGRFSASKFYNITSIQIQIDALKNIGIADVIFLRCREKEDLIVCGGLILKKLEVNF